LPELKRVIAAYGDRAVMEEPLVPALAVLYKAPPAPTAVATHGCGGRGARETEGGRLERLRHRTERARFGAGTVESSSARAALKGKTRMGR